MSQAAVFNEAAQSMGMNPLDFPSDSFPCDTCHNYAHYSRAVLVWEGALAAVLPLLAVLPERTRGVTITDYQIAQLAQFGEWR